MFTFQIFGSRRTRSEATLAAAMLLGLVAVANAQDTTATVSVSTGRIDFDYPGAAKATVEVDISRDMFGDMFGIGDAALAGVAEALAQSNEAQEGHEAVRLAAEKAAAAREFVAIAKNVVQDVRIRVYDHMQNQAQQQGEVIAHYNRQLESGGWDNVVRVNDGAKGVRVSIARNDGAVKGLFVVASEGDELVLVNVTCDVSPENAKLLSSTAVKAGLKAGLGEHLKEAMKHMK